MKKAPLAPGVSQGVFDTVRRISSDFERAQVLLAMIGAQPLDATARTAFIAAAESINSTFEQNRVLAALVKAERRLEPISLVQSVAAFAGGPCRTAGLKPDTTAQVTTAIQPMSTGRTAGAGV